MVVCIIFLLCSTTFCQTIDNKILNYNEISGVYEYELMGRQTLELKSDSTFKWEGTFHSFPGKRLFSYGIFKIKRDTLYFIIDTLYYAPYLYLKEGETISIQITDKETIAYTPITDKEMIDYFCNFSDDYSIYVKVDEYIIIIPEILYQSFYLSIKGQRPYRKSYPISILSDSTAIGLGWFVKKNDSVPPNK